MALEAGDGFISGLVITNPVNATDQVAQGDDHLRLIKTALKGTFPNLNGAVTATPAELNVLDVDNTLDLNHATVDMDGTTWNADYTNVDIDAATSLTLEGGACSLVLTTGIVMTGQLLGAAGSKTAPTYSFNGDGDTGFFRNGANNPAISAGDTTVASFASTQTTFTCTTARFDITTLDVNGVADISGNLTLSGTLTTPNSSASEVGFKGAPQNAQNGDYTLVLTDAGKTIYKASGGAGETITIPANASVAFPVGTIVRIVNNGGGDLTIAITSDTLSLAGAGTTGSRTLADHGVAVIEKVATTEWFISGVALS